jgi:hypothetical protein
MEHSTGSVFDAPAPYKYAKAGLIDMIRRRVGNAIALLGSSTIDRAAHAQGDDGTTPSRGSSWPRLPEQLKAANSSPDCPPSEGFFMQGRPMQPQDYINLLVAACGALGGWVLKTIWAAVIDQQKETKDLSDKVNSVEVLVAGQYVRRDELTGILTRIDSKLDAISTKLDGKADK